MILLAAKAGVAAAVPLLPGFMIASEAKAAAPRLITRPIPGTGETLPVVGLGTYRVFDVDDDRAKRAALVKVIRTLIAGGGKVIDTASTYGTAESVVGDLLATTGLRRQAFVATKLEADELTRTDFDRSLKRLHTNKIDLMQLHNVSDSGQSLAPLRKWKEQGLCRYIGITSTFHGDYPAVEAVLRREKPDFVQIGYSLEDREAEKRILPACATQEAAVLIALPLGHGRLFRMVRGRPLPAWAKEFGAASWAQFFLKFVLGNPTVTAVIPGTNNPEHMADNLNAGRGRLPDAAERRQMVKFFDALS